MNRPAWFLLTFLSLFVFLAKTTNAQTVLQGDLDKDGDVDIFDYNILVNNFGATGGNPADIDGDGDVDIFDYNILVANFGRTSGTPTPTNKPPTSTPTKTPTTTPGPTVSPPPVGACGAWPSGITQWVQPLAPSTGQAVNATPSNWQSVISGLQPGQTVYLRSGVYGAQGQTYHFNKSGSASAPITISGYPGDPKPILKGRYYLDGQYIRLTGVIIDGPTGNVGGPGPGGEAITLIMSGDHVELSNSEVRFDQWHAGVGGDGAFDYRIIGNYIHDNGGQNGDYTDSQWNTSHGAYLSPSSYGLIANNLVEHNDAKGLMGRHNANHLIFSNNTLVGNGRYGIDTTESTYEWIVANNIALNNGNMGKGGGGIFLNGTGPYTQRNNVFWNNSGNNNYAGSNVTVINPKVADPMLVNPDSGTVAHQNPSPNTDNRLKAGSGAINYADPNYSLPYDITGKCRGSSPDAGAYEF